MTTARITVFPLGNADTTRLDLRDGRKLLVDYANMRNPEDAADKRIDLPAELRKDLNAARRDSFDVVCFTHLDDDHVRGSSDFFWFDHAAKYQGGDRIRIEELWVPAGAITEVGCEDCARVIREEAKHRLEKGYGIRVFSRPDALKGWLATKGLTLEDRAHLITDAGQLVPGFSKWGVEGVEFFIHSPFGFRRNEREVEDRNQDSVVFQATFREGGKDTRALFTADMTWPGLQDIVNITRAHGHDERLHWDIMKLPHHCSYLSLSSDKGENHTTPVEEVRWLHEDAGQHRSLMISTSKPIPVLGTEEDKDPQPPHRQAANYYKSVQNKRDGDFVVTMERPKAKPRPTEVDITERGAVLRSAVSAPAVAIASSPVRAG
ncbi:hypothetical protein [Roseomonas chloroacetimidivorans]|uniref:hypothetical protein n=1 Tax=Roseomonas chloroacetimidivorans TaxID=1766656 RepID=UPI003C7912BA